MGYVWKLFYRAQIRVILGIENMVANSLDVVVGKFKTPIASQKKYKVDIVNRPSIPDNSKYWQVFEDGMQIKIFLELSGEFVNTQINNRNVNIESFQDDEENEGEQVGNKKLKNALGGNLHNPVKEQFYPKRSDSLRETF